MDGVGERSEERRRNVGRSARCEDRGGRRFQHPSGDRHYLLGRLAFRVDRLGEALPELAMGIDLRKTQVLDRKMSESSDRLLDPDQAGAHVREQGFQLLGAHRASVGWRTVPDLNVEQLTLALAVVCGVTFISLVITFSLAMRLRRLKRDVRVIRGNGEARDLVATLGAWSRRLDELNRRVDGVGGEQVRLADYTRRAIQRFHLVRYDAFEDMGGRLSFSAALLDDEGNGLVITSINGRTETRTYAKPIRNLSSDHNLSEEEGEAIAGAMADAGRGENQPTVSR
jgi:hypothetical protein